MFNSADALIWYVLGVYSKIKDPTRKEYITDEIIKTSLSYLSNEELTTIRVIRMFNKYDFDVKNHDITGNPEGIYVIDNSDILGETIFESAFNYRTKLNKDYTKRIENVIRGFILEKISKTAKDIKEIVIPFSQFKTIITDTLGFSVPENMIDDLLSDIGDTLYETSGVRIQFACDGRGNNTEVFISKIKKAV